MADVRLATYLDLQEEVEAREATDETVSDLSDSVAELIERMRILEGASGWES